MSGAPKDTSSALPSNQSDAAAVPSCPGSSDFSKGDVGVESGKSMPSDSWQTAQSTGVVPGMPNAYVTSTDVDTGLPETHPVYGDYTGCLQFVSGGSGDFLHQTTDAKAANEVPSLSNLQPPLEGSDELTARLGTLQTSQNDDGTMAGGPEAAPHAAVTEDVDKAQEFEVASEAQRESLVSPRSTAGDGNSSGVSGDRQDLTIFVGNVPDRTKWWNLRDFFASFGPVKYCKIPYKMTSRQKSHAFVEFTTEEGYNKALNARGDQLRYRGWLLRVEKRERWKPRQVQPAKREPASEAVEQECPPSEGSEKLNELDDLALSTIFSYLTINDLTRLERVCKRWQTLILAEWKTRTSISFAEAFLHSLQSVNDRILNSVLRKCGGNVKYLDLTYRSCFSREVLDIIMKHCPRLVKVQLPRGFIFTTKTAQQFAESCKHLEWLDLSLKNVSEKGLWYILHNCKKLRYLDIGGCKSISGKCFFMLGNEFKTIKLRNCDKVVDFALDKVVEKCPDIQELDISGCWSLTHAGLTRLFQSLRSLQILDAEDFNVGFTAALPFPVDITSETLSGIHHLKSLTTLRLNNNSFLTDEALTTIACGCTKLRELRISNVAGPDHLTDTGISSLVHLTDLQLLDISGRCRLTDEGVTLIIKQSKLQAFKAVGCQLTDATGVCLAESCAALESVDLRDNEQVTCTTLEAFVQHGQTDGSFQPHDLRLLLGGTAIPRSVKTKLPNHIHLNTVPYSIFYPGSAIPVFDFGQYDSDEDEDEGNMEGPVAIPAGMEDYNTDDDETTMFGIEEDFLENDDPVLQDYFNPS